MPIEDSCLATVVSPWKTAAVPPPATTARVQRRNGPQSTRVEAISSMPAAMAVGAASVSSRLSTQGM